MSAEDDALLRKTDIEKIASDGAKIYEKIKVQYEPNERGKFLAIEVESGKAYLATSSAEALELARTVHPEKLFYVVKIGYDYAETLAKSFSRSI